MTIPSVSALHVLKSETRSDLGVAGRIVDEAEQIFGARSSPWSAETIYALALLLHHFYAAVESLFERIAKSVDGELPTGADWHRQLLRRMQLEIEGVRPAVISNEAMVQLDEYRRFRHVVRHAYETPLREDDLEKLIRRVRSTLENTKGDLDRFTDFVDELIDNLSHQRR